MLGNGILLAGMAIGIVLAVALGLNYLIGWLSHNPLFVAGSIVGLIIGAVVSVFVTVKIRNAQDDKLVADYRESQQEVESVKPIRNPAADSIKKPIVKPTVNNRDIDGLVIGLSSLGYGKTESREAIERVCHDFPDLDDENIMKQALNVLSGNP